VLSASRAEKREAPLEFLVQRFAVDPATQWRRVFALGGNSQVLAVVRQADPGARVRVDFISDSPSPMVLHWGVCKPGARVIRTQAMAVV
jgi:alpha-glucan,water dikinase